MYEEKMAKVVFAVIDERNIIGSLPFGAQYCFKVDKKDKYVIQLKRNDANILEQMCPCGVHNVKVSLHKNYDKAAIMPSVIQSGAIDFEVKEGYVTRITAYRPKATKMTVALGTPPKVRVDVTLFPEDSYNS